MALQIAPRRTRKRKPADDTLAIGEMDQTIFACPVCARPLVNGARRCPGCNTRLIMGVPAQRASILIGAGLFAGLILGGGGSMVASALAGSAPGIAAGATARPSVLTSPPPSTGLATPNASSVPISSVPALTRSALLQATAVDARLATSSAALAGALASSKFDTYRVAELLRGMSADAVVGLQLSSHIATWSGGKELSGAMTAFYTSIQTTASEALSITIRNAKAYRAAGNRMISVIGGLAALDAQVRNVAAQAGVVIPPPAAPAP